MHAKAKRFRYRNIKMSFSHDIETDDDKDFFLQKKKFKNQKNKERMIERIKSV